MTLAVNTKKFQRTYVLEIDGKDGRTYSIGSADGSQPLLTMDFNITRNIMASNQQASIRIKNLDTNIRSQIYHDRYDTSNPKLMRLKAGYVGTPLSTIFAGQATTVMSFRNENEVDFVTEIVGTNYITIMANAFSNWTDVSGDQQSIINRLINDLKVTGQKYNLPLASGVIGVYNGKRYTFTANDFTWNIFRQETQNGCFIDNGRIFALQNNLTYFGNITEISSETGMLGTPKKSDTFLYVDMLFEPSLSPGQRVELKTNLTPTLSSQYNGSYKVTGVNHAGIISSAISGKCKTTAILQLTLGQIQKGFATGPLQILQSVSA